MNTLYREFNPHAHKPLYRLAKAAHWLLVLFFLFSASCANSAWAAPAAQQVDSRSWLKLGGEDPRVLDTSSKFDAKTAQAFTDAAVASGYPLYLLVISEELLTAYPSDNTTSLSHRIMKGEFGANFEQGVYFPNEVIVVVIAPFVVDPGVKVPDTHPWMRAVTDIAHTGQYTKFTQPKNSEQTFGGEVAQNIDRMVQTGLDEAKAQEIINYVVDAYKILGVFPPGFLPPTQTTVQQVLVFPSPTTAPTATPQVAPSSRNWSLPQGISVLFGMLVGGFYLFFFYLPSRRRALGAMDEVADLSADWRETRIADAEIAAVNVKAIASEEAYAAITAKIAKAAADGELLQAHYNTVMRPLRAWWMPFLLHFGYAHIEREISTKLLKDFRAAKSLLEEAVAAAHKIAEDEQTATAQLLKLAAEVATMNVALAALATQGIPSKHITAAAKAVETTVASAITAKSERDYETALTLCNEALAAVVIVATDAKNWPQRISGLSGELELLSPKLSELQTESSFLVGILAELKRSYARTCWVKVEKHPAAVRKIIAELQEKLLKAKQDLQTKQYDNVAEAIALLSAGIAKVTSLVKSVKELDEDLEGLDTELQALIPQVLAELEKLVEYIRQNRRSIRQSTEEEIQEALELVEEAEQELSIDLPDLHEVQKLLAEASDSSAKHGKLAKSQVEAMNTARNNAELHLKAAFRKLSELLNYIEDHEDEVGSDAEELAEEAQELYDKARQDFDQAEKLGDGDEEKRLKLYKATASSAAEAEETAEEAQERAEDDVTPDQPISTSYGGYSGSYNTYTPSSSVPTWRPPATVVIQSHRSQPARSYTTPKAAISHSTAVRHSVAAAPRPAISHSTARR